MIDYKINSIIEKEGNVTVSYTIYKGAITTENEMTVTGLVPVARYRRNIILQQGTRTFDNTTVSALRQKINVILSQKAIQISETVISEQK